MIENHNSFKFREDKSMIIEPKVREFICTTAHPEGCRENVKKQIAYVKSQNIKKGPKKVLVIGASTGYGLASRITAGFGCGAATIGIFFEKPSNGKRTATPGWYNTAAFEEEAHTAGIYAKSINGDAFSKEIKEKTIDLIKKDWGKADMVIYSLAAPRRTDRDGNLWTSSLKTTKEAFTEKSLDLRNNTIVEKTVYPAQPEEIQGTMKVMGGEDWMEWIEALKAADAIEENGITVAYSYIGPELTYPIYFDGTIGQAKRHLENTAKVMREKFPKLQSYVSVNKALVTQASAAIPIVPLYFAILYKVMKQAGNHEGCIEQISRLFKEKLLEEQVPVDEEGRIRMDDWELSEEVQKKVVEAWKQVTTENVTEISDIEGYWEDFYQMFGFHLSGVDYGKDVDVEVKIPSLEA